MTEERKRCCGGCDAEVAMIFLLGLHAILDKVHLAMGSAVGMSLAALGPGYKDAPSANGRVLLWACALIPTTTALPQPHTKLQPASSLPFAADDASTEINDELVNAWINVSSAHIRSMTAIRRNATVDVKTEDELKDALLMDGSTILITQNMILTNSISIAGGTVTVRTMFDVSIHQTFNYRPQITAHSAFADRWPRSLQRRR